MFSIQKKGYSKEEVERFIQKQKEEYEAQLAAQKERIFELKRELGELEKKIGDYKSRDGLISSAIYNAVAKAEEIERIANQKYELELEQLRAFHAKWQSYYDEIIKQYPLSDNLQRVSSFNRNMARILSQKSVGASELGGVEFPVDDENQEVFEEERGKLNKLGVNLEALSKVMDASEPEGKFESFITKISGKSKPKAFEPLRNIENYFEGEKQRGRGQGGDSQAAREIGTKGDLSALGGSQEAMGEAKGESAFSLEAESENGFDYEEAQNPKQSLEDIMRDLGFALDDE